MPRRIEIDVAFTAEMIGGILHNMEAWVEKRVADNVLNDAYIKHPFVNNHGVIYVPKHVKMSRVFDRWIYEFCEDGACAPAHPVVDAGTIAAYRLGGEPAVCSQQVLQRDEKGTYMKPLRKALYSKVVFEIWRKGVWELGDRMTRKLSNGRKALKPLGVSRG